MKRFLARVGALVVLYRLLFSGYSNTGPFTDNALPALAAAFFNNVENYLDTVTSAATDSHITADGNGNETLVSCTFTHGKITRIAFGFSSFTTGGTLVTHNLGAAPSLVLTQLAGTNATTWVTGYASTTTMTVFSSTNGSGWWLVIA